jgi:cytochrome P450/NADPH-cytochrome P450 reductase
MAEKTTNTTPIPGPQGLPLVGNALAIDLEFPLGTFKSFAEQYGKLAHPLISSF